MTVADRDRLQGRDQRARRMVAGLLADSHLMTLEQLPAKAAEYADAAGDLAAAAAVVPVPGDTRAAPPLEGMD
ncbi:hypothetical protein ACFYXS_35365 [Streptomyces sp. NPDC002574]|uniref:hypothetical protein n=1 Tax=Streptomyces sp. NPDC002574 TaxID=3364652 RepID=UPI0036B8E716